MSTERSERIADLEIRLMHQEDTIDTLSESLIHQQRILEQLHHHLEQLRSRLDRLETQRPAEGETDGPEPPPPHY